MAPQASVPGNAVAGRTSAVTCGSACGSSFSSGVAGDDARGWRVFPFEIVEGSPRPQPARGVGGGFALQCAADLLPLLGGQLGVLLTFISEVGERPDRLATPQRVAFHVRTILFD